MHTVGLFEAKQKLSELVERAGKANRLASPGVGNWQPSLRRPLPKPA
jgi:hypothetical protein